MRHDPAGASIIIMLRSLKLHGMFQAGIDNQQLDKNIEQRTWNYRASRGLTTLQVLSHFDCSVRHSIGKAPFIVIPREDTHHVAIHDFGLIRCKDGGMGVVVKVHTDEFSVGNAQDTF